MSILYLYKEPKRILNPGTGFLSGFTHSLNPYTGCAFGCSYCYVRQMPVALFRKSAWGSWVEVKRNAASQLAKELRRAKEKGKVTIFMASSTDPYQPIEYKARITRSLLEVLVENAPDFLLVQTRSPLVCRDIDLLQQLPNLRVSLTIETDSEYIRKQFTPQAPPIPARLAALKTLAKAGIPVQATIAPVLPSGNDFPKLLKPLVQRICLDDYFLGDGSGGKRTERLNMRQKYKELGLEDWYGPQAINRVYQRFLKVFPKEQILISQAGFEP